MSLFVVYCAEVPKFMVYFLWCFAGQNTSACQCVAGSCGYGGIAANCWWCRCKCNRQWKPYSSSFGIMAGSCIYCEVTPGTRSKARSYLQSGCHCTRWDGTLKMKLWFCLCFLVEQISTAYCWNVIQIRHIRCCNVNYLEVWLIINLVSRNLLYR